MPAKRVQNMSQPVALLAKTYTAARWGCTGDQQQLCHPCDARAPFTYLDLLFIQLPRLCLHCCHVTVRLRQARDDRSCQFQTSCLHGIAAALCHGPAAKHSTGRSKTCVNNTEQTATADNSGPETMQLQHFL
jgi:hypothetical protein